MMSLLSLLLMCVLVATSRHPSGRKPGATRSSQPTFKATEPFVVGRGTKFGSSDHESPDRGKVSYRLMQDKKLPSATQRTWRRLTRPFAWFTRRPGQGSGPDKGQGGQSVELQNFLDARNREIARRKSDGSKRGPEDTLH